MVVIANLRRAAEAGLRDRTAVCRGLVGTAQQRRVRQLSKCRAGRQWRAGSFLERSRWMVSRRAAVALPANGIIVLARSTDALDRDRFRLRSDHSCPCSLVEHDLFRKTGSHPRSSRGHAFWIMLTRTISLCRFAFRPQALRSGTPSQVVVPACRPCRTGSCRRFDGALPAGTASTR